jgi:sphingosine kinase
MTAPAPPSGNPFADPVTSMDGADRPGLNHSSLSVGKNASLTLATDSLVVLGELCTYWKAGKVANKSR